MTIRALILDDDPASRRATMAALAQFPELQVAAQFSTGAQLMDYLAEHQADLLFLDIELNQEFGFTIARELQRTHPELLLAFLTGHSSYAVDGYDFQPVNFLTKPIVPQKLEQTIQRVKRRLEGTTAQSGAQLMFQLQQGCRIIDVRDILYIERAQRKNILHTTAGSMRIAGYTMRELEEMLTAHGFFLCHQSFIVSLYRVRSLRDAGKRLYEATLMGCDEAIPVSRNRYEEMRTRLLDLGIPRI